MNYLLDLPAARIFRDEASARLWLETQAWEYGPVCPHCAGTRITKLKGQTHRPGLYQCNQASCRRQFSVTVGTVFEDSKLPLHKWLAALFLIVKAGPRVSITALHRTLGVSYKSTWHMVRRLREAMAAAGDDVEPPPLRDGLIEPTTRELGPSDAWWGTDLSAVFASEDIQPPLGTAASPRGEPSQQLSTAGAHSSKPTQRPELSGSSSRRLPPSEAMPPDVKRALATVNRWLTARGRRAIGGFVEREPEEISRWTQMGISGPRDDPSFAEAAREEQLRWRMSKQVANGEDACLVGPERDSRGCHRLGLFAA